MTLSLPGAEYWAGRPELFEGAQPGRILLLDSDGPAYRAAATVKTLDTALRKFIKLALTQMFLTNSEHGKLYLTASGCAKAYRDCYPTIKPYQGNRGGKAKPPLLEPLRCAIARIAEEGSSMLPPQLSVELHHYWEADDAMIMDAHTQGDLGLVESADKDLRLTPGPYLEQETGVVDIIQNRYGWIDEAYTPAGKLKVKGHGTKFFLAQLLMGDKADNVVGLSKLDGANIAERGALNFLMPIEDENEAIDAILRAYIRNGQNALAEAECLWLRRHQNDSAYAYFMEADLDPRIKSWLTEWHEVHLQLIADEKERRYERAYE